MIFLERIDDFSLFGLLVMWIRFFGKMLKELLCLMRNNCYVIKCVVGLLLVYMGNVECGNCFWVMNFLGCKFSKFDVFLGDKV